MENPNFLKNKYNLHVAPEVESAVKRTEKRTEEKVSQNPEVRIQNYLERIKEIINRQDPEKREQGLQALKKVLHDKFIIKYEEIPESYFETQRRIAREQGHGEIGITSEMREQHAEVIITDQESSLDTWIDYFASTDATYPDWLKYWAFRSILGMGEYDKEKKQFTKRSNGTTKSFPDLNREALAYTVDAIEKKYQGVPQEQNPQFQKLLQGENFSKLYAWAIDKVTPASQEQLSKVQGQWVKFDQGSDHLPLVESLQGHGTGWCTAGESTAKTQLQNGDFHVFYSQDEKGNPKIPRVAIRMENGKIAEIRGVAEQQNLDPYVGDVVQEKLQKFPDGKEYEKKNSDMKTLTEIEKKTKLNQQLTKNELIFLYEINSKIEGFGYQRDPRIAELQKTRNTKEDAPIVLDCQPDEIAYNQNEITENIKVYIGQLSKEILQSNIENIYTTFPEGKIEKYQIEIGGKTKEQLEQEMKERNITSYGQDLLDSPDFVISEKVKNTDLLKLTVNGLGFLNGATIDEIYAKAKDFDLELCPAEVGPQLRLQSKIKDWTLIAMKQIIDNRGNPGVFSLDSRDGILQLRCNGARPARRWEGSSQFIFRLHKLET